MSEVNFAFSIMATLSLQFLRLFIFGIIVQLLSHTDALVINASTSEVCHVYRHSVHTVLCMYRHPNQKVTLTVNGLIYTVQTQSNSLRDESRLYYPLPRIWIMRLLHHSMSHQPSLSYILFRIGKLYKCHYQCHCLSISTFKRLHFRWFLDMFRNNCSCSTSGTHWESPCVYRRRG